MSDIAQMMRVANPVPDTAAALTDDELESLLLLTQSRSGNVEVQERETQIEPEKKTYNGWFVAAAAFAAVILVVGVALLLTRPADTPPATSPTTTQGAAPTTVAAIEDVPTTTTLALEVLDEESVVFVEAMVAELNAGDFEASGAGFLAAKEFRVDSVDGGTQTDQRGWAAGMVEYWTEMDSKLEVTECTTSSTNGITTCILSRTSEFEPFYPEPETTVFQLRVEDGVMAFASWKPGKTDPWWPIYQEFRDWVITNNGDLARLNSFTDAAATAALAREYAAEYKATLEG